MPVSLRVILFLVSVVTFLYVLQKIRKTQMKIEDALFWVTFSFLIVLLSIFPEIAYYVTKRMKIMSSVNFVFLFFIFILLLKTFFMSIRLSQLEDKIRKLTQVIAIKEKENNEE